MPTAMAFSAYGDPEVLRPVQVDEPSAGAGQVRVRVKAAGVQPFDCKVRRGDLDGIFPVTFPQVLGTEFAGVVDQVGEGVTDVGVGSEVLGFSKPAAYAEFVVVDAARVAHKPASMSWEVAGVLSGSGQTAHIALTKLGVTAGETVLIHAAAGGVGTMAVQLADLWGATPIGTASEHNHDYLRSLGATPVSYGEGLVRRVRELAPQGVDAALDAAGGEAITASIELVTDKDRIGSLADQALAESHGIHTRLGGARSAQRLAGLAQLHTEGKLRVTIHGSVPLADAAKAHREVEKGHVRGKVVLTID